MMEQGDGVRRIPIRVKKKKNTRLWLDEEGSPGCGWMGISKLVTR